jgi:predicted nucleic acid-binding protein
VTHLVLDASASVDLLMETPTGALLEPRLPSDPQWWVPDHFFVEVATVLRREQAAGSLPAARATVAFGRLVATPARRAQTLPLMAEAWRRRGHLTVSDALYVVLAERLGATLVTTDEKLARSPGLAVATITANHD